MHVADLATPALLLDRTRFEANAVRMLTRAREAGVRLRVHMKTLKSMNAAEVAMDAGRAIAVATLQEADYFVEHGLDDVCYAVCVAPDRLGQVATLTRRAPRMAVFLDSMEVARALAEAASRCNVCLNAWLEVDCGEHRTGVAHDGGALLAIAKYLDAAPLVNFMGVATHAGHAYDCRNADEARVIGAMERDCVTAAAQTLRASGIECPGVSMGSTPTALHTVSLDGVTELRAGVYLAQDLFQAAIGSCRQSDIALSVLATVISRDLARNKIVVDAGGLALSKDRSTALTAHDAGYGLVVDVAGNASFGGLRVSTVHQEHGEIIGVTPLAFDRLPIGAKVRILPNHACMTGAMYDAYSVIDGAGRIVDRWPRTNGWG
jgi:D-serine deaminase-like pyridoxal phosphate-dependent protein